MREVNLFIGDYYCREYFNSDEDTGVEVYNSNKEYLGKLLHSVVDYVDFKDELENWIVDNEEL